MRLWESLRAIGSSEFSAYLLMVLELTAKQLIYLLVPLLLLAFIMQFIVRELERQSLVLVGRKAFIILFAWLGVPVHELGHLIFCIVFNHRVNDVVLFQTDSSDGSMGYVNHSYNPNSLYQRIGNLFIGIGPILFGSAVIYLLAYLLLGNGFSKLGDAVLQNPFTRWNNIPQSFARGIIGQIVNGFGILWQGLRSGAWKSVLFIYLATSIGLNITLSGADIKHIRPGLISLIFCLLIFNLGTAWLGTFSLQVLAGMQVYLNPVYAVMLLVMLISLPVLLLFTFLNRVF